MANWKRRIAKEWLIFSSVFVGMGLIALGLVYVQTKWEYSRGMARYSEDMIKYEEKAARFVKDNLSNWKPENTNPLEEIKYKIETTRFGKDTLISCPNCTWDELKLHREYQRNVIEAFKKLFPKYTSWDDEELERRLPAELDYTDFNYWRPDKPKTYIFTIEDQMPTIAVIAFASYLLVIFVRSIIWGIKTVRKT